MEKNKMEKIPVSSSNIAAVCYDPKNMTLDVEFLNGSSYENYGVSEMTFNDFKNAGSKGTFFDQQIKKADSLFRKK
jgi:hypothetical protein